MTFFVFSPDDEPKGYDKWDDAWEHCENSLQYFRECAIQDGEWSDHADEIAILEGDDVEHAKDEGRLCAYASEFKWRDGIDFRMIIVYPKDQQDEFPIPPGAW